MTYKEIIRLAIAADIKRGIRIVAENQKLPNGKVLTIGMRIDNIMIYVFKRDGRGDCYVEGITQSVEPQFMSSISTIAMAYLEEHASDVVEMIQRYAKQRCEDAEVELSNAQIARHHFEKTLAEIK